jgi:aspartate kinase
VALIVQKFGGTSVASIEQIKNVAQKIKQAKLAGDDIVVVASAMAGITDQLINLSRQVANIEDMSQMQEYDSIIATGEKVSCGLIALALQAEGIKARSWQGWQIPINTDEAFSKGRISQIDTSELTKALANDEVPVITGFQGVNNNRIVTLGRGGSDTSAAAIAAALNADRCDIYTDVDGIFTADPNIVKTARKLSSISYQHILELASSGARVLHPRAIEIAYKYKINLRVLSTFNNNDGTMLLHDDSVIEQHQITGIAFDPKITVIQIQDVENSQAVQSAIYNEFLNFAIKPIVYNSSEHNISFVIHDTDASNAVKVLTALDINHKIIHEVSLISLVGIGVKSDPSILQQVFSILKAEGISTLLLTNSEIKISFVIPSQQVHNVVNKLHDTFCV